MLSKSYAQLHYPKKSNYYADQLLIKYKGSAYADDALWTKARNLYALEDYVGSIQALSKIKRTALKNSYSTRADSMIGLIAQNNLSIREIVSLLESENDPEIRPALQSQYLEKIISLQRYELARAYLKTALKKESSASRIGELRNLLKQIDNKAEGPVRIGLIVSLTGFNSDVGKAIKNGVELAVERHNLSKIPRIELAIHDDQSDIVQAIFAAKELSEDDGISAIIGPIESNTMAAVSVIADRYRIPIISPTATGSGLTQIGEWVYQANVNIESRSEAIARYAVNELGYKKFAILSPSDNYGDIAATAFAKTVEKLGGKIVVFEKFYENTSDYKGQLVHMRKMGFIEKVLPQTSYRYLSKLTQLQIDSIYAQYYPIDSASVESEYNMAMDFIDALFLPVYTDDIKYIAPQLAFYNIKTQLLGGDNWYDLTELKLHQIYINGVLFVSESYMDPENSEIRAFNEAFKATYKSLPSREAAYGYDLMNMLASIIESGYYTSEEIQGELRKGITWNGLHNKIVFTKDSRVNSSVHILQFLNGQTKKQTE
jgi:ABC-type branched-subunit amino acid transport system substrate-binding protein